MVDWDVAVEWQPDIAPIEITRIERSFLGSWHMILLANEVVFS